jgi:oligopeptide/dipeptide ABC transporter ATP-binding protein
MTMETSLVTVDDLSIQFPTARGPLYAVTNVSFELARGRVTALLGETGAGKSVTGRALLGLNDRKAKVTAGRVTYRGQDVLTLGEGAMAKLRGRHLTMVFQDARASLNPLLTIGEQVSRVARYHLGLSRRQAKARAVEIMQAVGIADADARMGMYPHQLSGGLNQRVMLAAALICGPDVMVADEPTTGLDVTLQSQVVRLIRTLSLDSDFGCLFITHDVGVAADVSDVVLVMYRGVIVERGSTQAVLNFPLHPYTQALLRSTLPLRQRRELLSIPGTPAEVRSPPVLCTFLDRCTQRIPRCATSAPPFVEAASGGAVLCHLPAATRMAGVGRIQRTARHALAVDPNAISAPRPSQESAQPPHLAVSMLSKQFRAPSGYVIDALRSLSLTIARGELLGVVGESGAGKTTLARCLVALERPDSGSIVFDGVELVGAPRELIRPLRPRLQMVFQNPTTSLNPRLTARRAVAEPLRLHRPELEDPNDAALELLETVGLERQTVDRYPHALSGGQRQRVCIARAIACNPEFLILDEPTSALDLSTRAQVLVLLQELRQRLGLTCMLISHDIGVIRSMADRVVVMYAGEIVETAPVDDLINDPQHPYTVGLLAAVPPTEARLGRSQPLRGETGRLPASGCPLHPRCSLAMNICRERAPRLLPLSSSREVACFAKHPPTPDI